MPLPVAHALCGACIILLFEEKEPRNNWKHAALGAALAICPDFDLFFVWFLNFDIGWHGSFSHSILFAIAAGLLASTVTGKLAVKSSALFGSATLSHAVLDATTSKTWDGVELFWPLSSTRYRLGLFDYFEFYPGSRLQPLPDEILRALIISLYEAAIFAPVLLLLFLIKRKATL